MIIHTTVYDIKENNVTVMIKGQMYGTANKKVDSFMCKYNKM